MRAELGEALAEGQRGGRGCGGEGGEAPPPLSCTDFRRDAPAAAGRLKWGRSSARATLGGDAGEYREG
jgi:hypothetical protein